jgi:hypothetical protein
MLTTARALPRLRARPGRRLGALEPLRDHPHPIVQNRVADALRALARHHPGIVADTCARWLRESPGPATRRIVRRALRSPPPRT